MGPYGTVELGGTKCDVAVGTTPDELTEPTRIETTDPETTLSAVVRALSDLEPVAVGVSSFGPIETDRASPRYGTMLATPKPGWSGFPVRKTLLDGLGVQVVVETDVNGAALGEGRWGASRGLDHHCYVTVGTGIGAGVIVGGQLLRGEGHPEFGHIRVDRHRADDHDGSCPFHGDCLEGLASGPALEARFGPPGDWDPDEVTELAAHYVASGLAALFFLARPQRVVIGGGVSSLPGFHSRVRTEVSDRLADYPGPVDTDLLISAPGLGTRSGLAGGLILAGSR